MADQTPANRPVRKRSVWPFALMIAFCVHASIVFITMTLASRTPANAEPGYYESAVTWDEQTDARLAAKRAGWQWSLTNEGPVVTLDLKDKDGQPIRGATVAAVTFHRAAALDRTGLTLVERSPGVYTAELPALRVGLWDLRMSVTTPGGVLAELTDTIELRK